MLVSFPRMSLFEIVGWLPSRITSFLVTLTFAVLGIAFLQLARRKKVDASETKANRVDHTWRIFLNLSSATDLHSTVLGAIRAAIVQKLELLPSDSKLSLGLHSPGKICATLTLGTQRPRLEPPERFDLDFVLADKSTITAQYVSSPRSSQGTPNMDV